MRVLLDIDAVIRVIRESDDPKTDLMTHFSLSEIQAEDILEIRLRQLARLAGIEIEKELAKKREDAAMLQELIDDEGKMRALIAQEISEDAERFGDERRTEILDEAVQKVQRSTATSTVLQVNDEPVTVLVSQKGWVRTRAGHQVDLSTVSFKEGDSLRTAFQTRSTENLAMIDSTGRAFSIPVAQIPGGKSEGMPLSSQIDVAPGSKISAFLAGPEDSRWLIASTGGYGFITTLQQLLTRQKAGKAFLTVDEGETPLAAIRIPEESHDGLIPVTPLVFCRSSDGRGLLFPLEEVKELPKGKGVKLQNLAPGASLVTIQIVTENEKIPGVSPKRMPVLRGSRAAKGRPIRS